MTRDDVIRMAKEAGFDEWEIGVEGKAMSALVSRRLAKLERFAELVAARHKYDAERMSDLLGKANAVSKIRMSRINELTNVLQAFSDYVTDEQMSTDGPVTYSTSTINHWAFLARKAIDPARAKEQTP